MDEIRIKGADMSFTVGQRAKLQLEDGRWVFTSPVQEYLVANSNLYVKTANHIYVTK